MSSKTKNTGVSFDQDETVTATIDQPEVPAADAPVIRAEKYVFGQYQDGSEYKGRLDVKSLFRPGFDPTPYDFTWIRFNREDDAQYRYFTKVTKALHSKWFKEDAFDKMNGSICAGRGAPGTPSGLPEVTLYVRTKEAADAEREQMLARSAKNRNPIENEEYRANINGISKAIGSNFMRGSGLTQETKSGWEN